MAELSATAPGISRLEASQQGRAAVFLSYTLQAEVEMEQGPLHPSLCLASHSCHDSAAAFRRPWANIRRPIYHD